MPEIRYYTVKQVREVEVVANSEIDAIRIADAAFTHGQNTDNGVMKDKGPVGIWGNTRRKIKVLSIKAKRAS